MENPKVFEFAKEVGMETLSLMDKIKEWKLPVKNHMAELTPDLVELIKNKLAEVEGSKKKVPVKKKEPAKKKAATTKASAAAKKEIEPPVVKKTTVAKPMMAKPTAAAKPAPVVPAKKKDTKTVIRRTKAEAQEEIEKEIPASVVEEAHQQEEISTKEEYFKAQPVEEVEEPTVKINVRPELEEVIEEAAAPVEVAIQEEEPDAEEEAHKKKSARKKEVTIGASGLHSSATPVSAPKRNIIGRMDLSRVQVHARSMEQRPQRTGPQTLRTGFVAQDPTFFEPGVIEAEAEEKKKEKLAKKTPKAPREEVVQSFSAADYRKREMVFQPKKKKVMKGEGKKTVITTPKASKRVVKVYGQITVQDLAQEMGIKVPQLITKFVAMGEMVTMNTVLEFDTVALIAPDFGFEAQNSERSVDEMINAVAYGELGAEPTHRAPVVTVMGHVDHGKTSLLDAIRNTDVASGEAGGITQHIGAYSVKLESGDVVTFIDTPGHEAFTHMRARGANVTDIAIIVVAADDGVMPQTAEAINHAKAAGVPIIIAINKMDRPGANPDRIRQQLTEFEIVPEEWGGSNIFCHVSATQRTGVKELLEQIILQAEILELKANPKRSGTGIVIESRQEKGRGNVATFLVKDGTIKVGQHVVVGSVPGKIRSIFNDRGVRIEEAGPSMPVEVLGLDETPKAGDRFDICKDEKAAIEIAAKRKEKEKITSDTPNSKMTLDELFAKVKTGALKELPIVLKSDVAGSTEAILGSLAKLGNEEVKIKVIHNAVGGINESDVLLASTSGGIVVGFNVRPDGSAERMAKNQGVEIRTYTIIYDLTDDLKKAMAGLLEPITQEQVLGRAEVRNIFGVPKVGVIAGCFVTEGKILRSGLVRLVRDGRQIYSGKIASLKRFKDDAREVASGFECGLGIENYNDIKTGDVVEVYQVKQIQREL